MLVWAGPHPLGSTPTGTITSTAARLGLRTEEQSEVVWPNSGKSQRKWKTVKHSCMQERAPQRRVRLFVSGYHDEPRDAKEEEKKFSHIDVTNTRIGAKARVIGALGEHSPQKGKSPYTQAGDHPPDQRSP